MKVEGIKNTTIMNRAETHQCQPELYFTPRSVEELKQIISQAREKKCGIRVKGNGNSLSPLFLTSDYVIDMKHFNKVIEIDMEKEEVKVQGGTLIRDLHKYLNKVGLDLSFFGADPSLTAAGAINVAIHSNGITSGTLSSYVTEMELMTSSGQILKCSRNLNEDVFRSVGCGLGAFGVILTATFQCESNFKVEKIQYGCHLDEILSNLDFYVEKYDYFKFNWFPHTSAAVVYDMIKTTEPVKQDCCTEHKIFWLTDVLIGYYMLQFIYLICILFPFLIPLVHWLIYQISYTWGRYEISLRKDAFPFGFKKHVHITEWAIPIDNTTNVLNELKTWFDKGPHYIHFPVEVSFSRKDDFFLSPAGGSDVCYISIPVYRPFNFYFPYEKAFADFAEIMKKYKGKPQWGKEVFGVSGSEIQKIFPNFEKWNSIRQELDPDDTFLNPFLIKLFTEQD